MFVCRKVKGFTLIEVLVALAIFALCAAVLSAQSTITNHNRQRLIEQQMGLWVAKNRLAELRINISDAAVSKQILERQTEAVQAGIDWLVDQAIEPTADAQLNKITLSVRRKPLTGRQFGGVVQIVAFLEDGYE